MTFWEKVAVKFQALSYCEINLFILFAKDVTLCLLLLLIFVYLFIYY